MENKLTIEQLKNYLGTGLKFYKKDHIKQIPRSLDIMEMKGLDFFSNEVLLIESVSTGGACKNIYLFEQKYRPAFFQLSDLDKLIPELGFVPIEIICDEIYNKQPLGFIHPQDATSWFDAMYLMEGNTDDMSFWMFQKLFQWHFWPFGDEYFEQDLVIDKLKHGS